MSNSQKTSTVTLEGVINMPGIYTNGFSLGLSNADVNMMLLCNGSPQAQVNMSFSTAKSLHVLLEQALKQLEEATGQEIMTSEHIGEKLEKAVNSSGK